MDAGKVETETIAAHDEPVIVEERDEPVAGAEIAGSERPLSNRISGGPVWGGFAVAFATWILLELVLFALSLTGIAPGPAQGTDAAEWWWSFAAAVTAVFAGGFVAGTASLWKGAGDGALQGLTVWSILVVAVLIVSALGAGIGFGAFGEVLTSGRASIAGANLPAEAVATARDAAGFAALTMLATLLAGAFGGMLGAKTWPKAEDRRARMTA